MSLVGFADACEPEKDLLSTSKEHQLILNFCHQPGGLPQLNFQDLLLVSDELVSLSTTTPDSQTAILASVKRILSEKEDATVLRCLLLVEKILEGGAVSLNLLFSLRSSLDDLKASENSTIVIKAAKILAIFDYFKQLKTS